MIIYLLLLQTGCAGLADYSVELPGNYSIVRTSAHQVTISPKNGDTGWESPAIPTKVTEVAWNENHILAKQLGLMKDPDSSNGYKIPNKEDVHFWLLEVESGEVMGPFDETSFNDKKKEIGISKVLC
ncbi:DUF3997 domain-containing protein [Ureibacillus sp. NPDC094379]